MVNVIFTMQVAWNEVKKVSEFPQLNHTVKHDDNKQRNFV